MLYAGIKIFLAVLNPFPVEYPTECLSFEVRIHGHDVKMLLENLSKQAGIPHKLEIETSPS